MPNEQPTCEDRIEEHLSFRLDDLRDLFEQTRADDDSKREEAMERMMNYGLEFSYHEPEEEEGYFRWLLSWGGPSDEFRFYTDQKGRIHRIEYWFKDWFDGASRTLTGREAGFIENVWEYNFPPHVREHALEQSY